MTEHKLGDLIATGRTAEVFALEGRPDLVVKLFFPGFESNAAKEFGISQLLSRLGIAAPTASETVVIDGRAGMVLQRVDGPSLLDLISKRPWATRSIGRTLAELHLAMHTAPGEGLPRLADILEKQITNSDILDAAERDAALALLRALPDGDRLCHGDFHPGNILVGDKGPVTIDWTNVSCGPPLADLAKTTLLVRGGAPPRLSLPMKVVLKVIRAVLLSSYFRRYDELEEVNRAELRRWVTVVAAARLSEKIPEERDYLISVARKGLSSG